MWCGGNSYVSDSFHVILWDQNLEIIESHKRATFQSVMNYNNYKRRIVIFDMTRSYKPIDQWSHFRPKTIITDQFCLSEMCFLGRVWLFLNIWLNVGVNDDTYIICINKRYVILSYYLYIHFIPNTKNNYGWMCSTERNANMYIKYCT